MTRAILASEELQTLLEETGHRVERSPLNLVKYFVHREGDERAPGVFLGEMSERDIWDLFTEPCADCRESGFTRTEVTTSFVQMGHRQKCAVCKGIGRVLRTANATPKGEKT